MSSSYPVTRISPPYINGMVVTYVDNTTFTITAGSCSDSGNITNITFSDTVTVNAATNGANGLDTGSLGASKLYYVFAITDTNAGVPDAALISLSATPLLPFGYTSYRRIGYIYTDGSSHFLKFKLIGNGSERTYWYDAAISVLAAGASETFAAVTLTNVPAVSTNVILAASFTPATAADSASVRPTGSSSTAGYTIVSGVVAAKAQLSEIRVPCGVASSLAKIDYLCSAASCALTLSVLGYEDYL